jgi:hypothetical protein
LLLNFIPAFYAIEISLIQTKSDKSRQQCDKFYHDPDFVFGFWATGEAVPFAGESAVTWWLVAVRVRL